MQYLPNESMIAEMLEAMGMRSMEELFADVPTDVSIEGLALPDAMPEQEVAADVEGLLSDNITTQEFLSFLGGGMYDHYVPATVPALAGRAEFYTSYTPYQPEASQGILQAMFEYQSLVCALTGMDVSNISMYDGATAMAEAALMSVRVTRKDKVIVPSALDPVKRSVLWNYVYGAGVKVEDVPYDGRTGQVDRDALAEAVDDDTAMVYLENPNYFGCLEETIVDIKDDLGKALLVVGVNPVSLGILNPPGDYGADIVVGDGQPLGNPVNYGGPTLGIFTCAKRYARQMPGRIIGLTRDVDGNRAFHMALQTREQHIRRSKATSNICTNENLNALAFAIHLATVGSGGLVRMAQASSNRAHTLAKAVDALDGFKAPLFESAFFNEFTVGTEHEVGELSAAMLMEDIFLGVPLINDFPDIGQAFMMATTERTTEADIDDLVVALRAYHSGESTWFAGGEL
ncbi:MAG: aminomethyl-transferring glycine dehydrogenase subunit GcvPA [Thermoplasmata archaeon]|nr:MAG: aminomethyl-transferring glycine dehydrogenase subunit GcvPA [Thermoplasmata archaeon]